LTDTTKTPLSRSTRALLLIALALAAVGMSACAGAGDAEAVTDRIVALGDSSASGPELGETVPGSPAECARTNGGYPALVAQRLTPAEFVNATCSGAVTSSLSAGFTYPGSGNHVPAQLDSLNGSESIVMLSIGDNNAGFGEVTTNCLFHNQSSDDYCTEKYVVNGANQLVQRAQSIGAPVAAGIDAIKSRAPKAKIILVGYPDMAPPDAAGCSGLLWLTSGDAPVFDAWEVAVNDTLRSVALQKGVYFVDTYSRSREHTACAPEPSERWTNPYTGVATGIALHPSAAGASAVADMVVEAINAAKQDNPPTELPAAGIAPLKFSTLRRQGRGAIFSRKAPRRGGRVLRLQSADAGKVSLRLEANRPGMLVNGVCRPARGTVKKSRRCTRHVARGGWWSVKLDKGRTTVHLTGRAPGRPLSPGSYRLRLQSSALDIADPTTRSFRVVR
jgi:lysophospholipase L1-like esterase